MSPTPLPPRGRLAVVTGASDGIGTVIATRLAALGADSSSPSASREGTPRASRPSAGRFRMPWHPPAPWIWRAWTPFTPSSTGSAPRAGPCTSWSTTPA